MSLSFRFARREVFVRWQNTLTFVVAVAIGVCTLLVTASMSESLTHARDQVIAPLLAADVDVVVSTLATRTSSALPQHETVNTLTLHPGSGFSLDNVRHSDLIPIDASVVERLSQRPGVDSLTSALVVTVDRLQGVSPPLVVIPERSIPPLTDSENADVRARLADDKAYQQLMRRFDELSDTIGGQNAPAEQCMEAEELTAQLRSIELSYYPERFAVFSPDSFAVTSVEATRTSITVAGLSDPGDSTLLGEANLIAGALPASGTAQAVVALPFANTNGLDIGATLSLAGGEYTIVGIVQPPIGLLEADVYLTLNTVARISGVETPNLLVLTTDSPESVAPVIQEAQTLIPSARVSTPDGVSLQVSALLNEANTALHTGLIVVIVAVIAGSVGTVVLATFSSIGARSTDIGVLIALGWRRVAIVRQALLEMLLRVGLGAALGVTLAWAADALISRLSEPVAVQILTQSGQARDSLIHLAPSLPLPLTVGIVLGAIALSLLALAPPLMIMSRQSASALLISASD